jgi:hypothetical protein
MRISRCVFGDILSKLVPFGLRSLARDVAS